MGACEDVIASVYYYIAIMPQQVWTDPGAGPHACAQVRCVGAPGPQLNGVDEISIQKCRCLRLAFRRGTPLLKNRRCNRRNADRNSLIVFYHSETKKLRRKRDKHVRYNPAAEICAHRLKQQYEWNLNDQAVRRSDCCTTLHTALAAILGWSCKTRLNTRFKRLSK